MSTFGTGVKPPPGNAGLQEKTPTKTIHLNPENKRDQGTIELLRQVKILFNNCNDLNARLLAAEKRLKEYDEFMIALAGRMLKTCVIFPEKKKKDDPPAPQPCCEDDHSSTPQLCAGAEILSDVLETK